MKREILALICIITGGIVLNLAFPFQVSAFFIEDLGDIKVEGDFTVGPAQNEVFLNPGETTIRNLLITNRLGGEMDFVITLEDFTGTKTGETSVLLLGDERGPYSLRDYLKPDTTEFTLAHGERMILPIEIFTPEDAEPGGRYGAVLVSAVPPGPEIEAGVGEAAPGIRVIARIAALYFVRVKGDVDESGFLKEIRMADGKKFYNKGPFSFNLLFENTGNVHLNPYGIIEIKNLLGKKTGEIEIEPWFAMPNSLRSRTVTFDKKWLIGRYTATAKINRGYRGYEDVIDEKSVIFWVLPWQVVLPVLMVIILLAIFFRWFFGKFEIRARQRV